MQPDVELYRKFQKSPIFFIEKVWKIIPQPPKEDKKQIVESLIITKNFDKIRPEYFVPFIKNKHLTWQQWLILIQVENALKGEGKKRISIVSGHGIGKSATLAWLIIWYLFCYKDAQIPCTAPTAEQIHDILWKELAIWLGRMPEELAAKYDWTTGYLRIKERPETWFARARTARKEKPEALAGIHGDYVLTIADEASGVPIEIFNTAEGALTGENVLVILIGNGLRLLGYFYDSFRSDKKVWQNLSFNSEDSPIVEKRFTERIARKHGKDSDEYRIRVLGKFPKEDAIDEKGYAPLLMEKDIKMTDNTRFVGRKKLGVDSAGEGSDESSWIQRDAFRAQIVMKEKISDSMSIANNTLLLMEMGDIVGHDVTIDNFGKGANVARDAALAGQDKKAVYLNGVNVGDKAEDSDRFINIRAEAYWRLREWIKKGGEIVRNGQLVKELLYIRYRRTRNGRIQIMPKEEMRKEGYPSPNRADALMLTFVDDDMSSMPNKTVAPHTETSENIHDAI